MPMSFDDYTDILFQKFEKNGGDTDKLDKETVEYYYEAYAEGDETESPEEVAKRLLHIL